MAVFAGIIHLRMSPKNVKRIIYTRDSRVMTVRTEKGWYIVLDQPEKGYSFLVGLAFSRNEARTQAGELRRKGLLTGYVNGSFTEITDKPCDAGAPWCGFSKVAAYGKI